LIEKEKQETKELKKKQNADVKLQYDPKQSGKSISILSHHGKFVTVMKNGMVACNKKKRSNAQTFISVPLPSEHAQSLNKVAFKTFDNKFISVRKDGLMTCKATEIGKSETFIVEKSTNKKDGTELWSFKSIDGLYVSAQWITGQLIADREEVDNWEKFMVQVVLFDDDDWE